MFGSSNPFGQSSTSPFGSQSVFGQNNTPSNNPFATNPFGGASPFNAQTGGSIFGGTSTGVFGATQSSSPLASTPSFGVSSTPAFGSSAPAFGASSTPAFGSSSSSFGGSSAFGQKPAFGGFGSTPTQTSPFGGTFQQTQSTFGSSVFGSSAPFGAPSQPAFGGTSTPAFGGTSTPAFGGTSTPAFGASSNPAFGATSNPAFGATSTPAFGATTTPAFGSSSSVFGSTGTAFGAPSTPAFGSGGAFGATSTPTFGAPSTSAFGATSTPLFGASSSGFGTSSSPSFNFGSSPSFGQSTSAFGSSPFGTTPSPFGAQTSAFGSQSNASAFGSPTFGQSSFGSQQRGSRVTGYSPTVETDGGTGTQPAGKLESISAMPAYKEKSHEELRWEDYQMGDKGGPSPAQTPGGFGMSTAQSNPFGTSTAQPNPFGTTSAQPNPFGTSSAQPNPFGTSTAQSSPFGTSTTFGQSSANPFSSSVSPNPFASKTNTFGTSPFGASTSAFNSSPFGSSSTSSLFGTPSTPSIFGGTTSASPFGANTSPSLFGSSSSPSLFGSSPSMFSAPGTTSAFSSNFNTQSAPLFQSTTPSFGLGQSPFGQSTPTFGQTSIFSTPSTGFGLSASSTPSLLNTTNQSAFSSPFQTTQPAQTSGAFSFGNFGQTQASNGFGGTFGGFGQSTFGQPSGSQNTMVMQPTVSNPFGTLPAMPQISIGRSGSSPSVQYGISSMPVTDKPSPVRVSSLLTPRHLSQRRINLPSRKYHPKKDAPMAPFYCDEEEAPNTPKADALFVPRENPRALVIHPSEKWPSRTSMEKSSLLKSTTEPVHNKGELYGSPAGNDTDKDHNAKTEQKANRVQEDHTSEKTDSYTLSGHRAGEAAIVNEHGADIEGLMPKLKHADYYTQPQIQELAAKERAEPGFCQHVKNFVIGRHGYGSIKFDGETDVRRLDLESLVQFNDREVVVYMDDSKKPPVGQGLNKPAEVSLLNIKCVDKKTGQQYTEGRRVEKYKEMLKKKAEEQGAEFVSYDPLKGEWRFRVKHFSRYSF